MQNERDNKNQKNLFLFLVSLNVMMEWDWNVLTIIIETHWTERWIFFCYFACEIKKKHDSLYGNLSVNCSETNIRINSIFMGKWRRIDHLLLKQIKIDELLHSNAYHYHTSISTGTRELTLILRRSVQARERASDGVVESKTKLK